MLQPSGRGVHLYKLLVCVFSAGGALPGRVSNKMNPKNQAGFKKKKKKTPKHKQTKHTHTKQVISERMYAFLKMLDL